ncbi:hypothetical protein PsAD5_00550 [Pseudovibrio sp. Ad5]|nr:hypothetical protein PsAD5_00550 [Pseudovibrio sp. Ad5]
MKTPAGAARGMARPAPLPKRSCLNEDAQTGEHKGSAVRFSLLHSEPQAKHINRPHAGPSWTRVVIFSAMCMRNGIGNPLRIGGGVRRVAEMAEDGKGSQIGIVQEMRCWIFTLVTITRYIMN